MNKKFTKLMAALALLVFMMPSMAGWGQTREEVIIWSESFDGLSAEATPTTPTNEAYTGVTYTCSNGTGTSPGTTKIMNENLANGAGAPELMVGKKGSGSNATGGKFTVNIPLNNFEGTFTLTYYQNKQSLSVSSTTTGVSGGQTIKPAEAGQQSTTFTGITSDLTSITIVFQATTTNNVRLDDIVLTGTPAGGGNTPSITANDVNITFDEEAGEIAYTINNPVDGGSIAASATSDWLTVDENAQSTTSGSFGFLCDANPSTNARTATVTLTYTYNTNETVTKDVTVTQAGNPNAFDNISDIDSENTHYKIKGTVLAVSARAFVLGDGTGYVYYYNGNSAPSVAVNDKKIVEGTTTSYGHVIQFPNSATITATETSNYNDSPAATVITAIPDYTLGLHLSDYFQFEGTLTQSSGYYYVSCGEGNINISYPSSTQQTDMNALENKTVRVKGYFAGINSSNYFSVILESVEEVANPSIEATPSPFTAPSYVVGTDEPTYNVLTVNGSNLTANISLTLDENSDFEMSTDLDTWSSSLILTQTNGSITNEEVAIRLKAGLAKGNYNGTVTLSSTDAQNVVVDLSGSVTGQMYSIILTQPATGGTIASDLEVAEEGTIVTLTATPDAAFNFGSWVVEDENENPITVTDNQFEMPAGDVLVTATFTQKDTYAITCIVTPNDAALMEASPTSAYEGQTVTFTYVPETGYTLSSIVITKTTDGSVTGISPTATGDGFSFTMPGYAVTATATFLSDIYTGSFIKFTADVMEEGDYILVYDGLAMNNTPNSSNNKLGATDVEAISDVISNPSRGIVWHIAPIGTEGKWTIYNAVVNKYVNASSSSNTNITLIDNASYSNSNGAKWSITIDVNDNTYDFSNLTESRALRYYESSNVFGHYATTNGGPLTLYKYTVLTERTITFNGNGGTYNNETTYTQTVYDGISANLTANQFTKANANFIGWATTENGEVEYTDEAEITATADITLYAQWETIHTLTLNSPNADVFVFVNENIEPIEFVNNQAQVPEGATVYVSIDPMECYLFSNVSVTYGDNQTVPTTEEEPNVYYSFTMPTDDATVTVSTTAIPTHTLTVATLNHVTLELTAGEESNEVQSGEELCEGIHVTVVATPDEGYVMGSVSVVYGNNQSVEVTTEGRPNEYSFYMPTGDVTITVTVVDAPLVGTITFGSAAGSTNINEVNVTGDDSMGNTWTITTAGTTSFTPNSGYAQVGSSSKPATSITFTTTLPQSVVLTSFEAKFGGNSNTAGNITLKVGETTVGSGSLNGTNDVVVSNTLVASGNTLTVTVTDIARGVKCYYISYEYVEPLHIDGYNGGDGGWYLIASPVTELTPSAANGFITDTYGSNIPDGETGTYDLYYFDQTGGDNGKEWKNYRQHTFNLESGKGYLYASKEGTDLIFTGTAYNGNGVVNLTYSESTSIDDNMRGWNLIGNPFGTTANLPSGLSYYTLNESRTELTPGSATTIGAMKAIFVQATATGQSVTFTKQTRNAGSNAILSLNLSNDSNGLIDRTIVRFDEGNALPKFMLNPNNTKVFIPVESKDYAVVRHEAQGEMPVNFKAAENGTYTLTVNPEGVEMNYLHLIDNMTGADIDLLAATSTGSVATYTFNASTTDYSSRFRLVFAANNEDGVSTGSTAFAFYSNGTWVINNTGEATLQVVDVNGRILSSETVNGSVSKAINAPAGVYMLRLINGNDVKTQKIVVR